MRDKSPIMILILNVLQYILHGVNRCFDFEHHTKYFGRRPMMSTCHHKRETCHWCMQASRYWKGVSKSTSWIMSWCRQEVTRRRRALMYPPSTTRNECNDFEDRMWLMTQCSRMAVMKMKVYEYFKGWSLLSDFSWICRRHWMNWKHWPKTMDGVIDHRYDNHQADNPTKIVTEMKWKCHVQERHAIIKWFIPFSIFPSHC